MTIDQMRRTLFQEGHKNIDSKSDHQVAAIYKRVTNKEKK